MEPKHMSNEKKERLIADDFTSEEVGPQPIGNSIVEALSPAPKPPLERSRKDKGKGDVETPAVLALEGDAPSEGKRKTESGTTSSSGGGTGTASGSGASSGTGTTSGSGSGTGSSSTTGSGSSATRSGDARQDGLDDDDEGGDEDEYEYESESENGKLDPNHPEEWPLAEQRRICRKMFFIGCLFLPWLWAVNTYFFRHALSRRTAHKSDVLVVRYTRLSLVGALLGFGAIFVWLTIYLFNRVKWAGTLEKISIVWVPVYP